MPGMPRAPPNPKLFGAMDQRLLFLSVHKPRGKDELKEAIASLANDRVLAKRQTRRTRRVRPPTMADRASHHPGKLATQSPRDHAAVQA